jgi:tetratricopeptide (TPR) repeat protein
VNEPAGPRHPLVEARRMRNWSQEGLASLLQARGLGTTRKTVMRWERGVVPDRAAQTAMVELFEVSSQVANRMRWPYWLPTGRVAAVTDSWDHQGTISALSDVAKGVQVDRREFLALTGAELLLPIYAWRLNSGPWDAYHDGNRRQVSLALVEEVERLVSVRRKMDDEHGGGPLLEMLHSDLRFVADLLKNGTYRGQIGRRLHAMAGEIARLAGWTAFDSARHAAAQQYYLAALRAAAAIGDRTLGVNIVGFMGVQAYSTGHVSDATQLMDVAVTEAKTSPAVVRAMTSARAGRAYAKAGNAQAARGALTEANVHLSRAVNGDSPPWAYWVDQTRITAQVGRALFDLGDYAGATRELADALHASGASYPRDRATWLGRIAMAQVRTGDLEAGCESGRKAVDLLSGQVESARGLEFLRAFHQELAAYKNTESVRDFVAYSTDRLN